MSRVTENIRQKTREFASGAARLRMSLPDRRREVVILGDQLVRAGVSVAAHVHEASQSQSEAEICSWLEGAIQQADESVLCLEMLQEDSGISQGPVAQLRRDADEIITTFSSIISRMGGSSL